TTDVINDFDATQGDVEVNKVLGDDGDDNGDDNEVDFTGTDAVDTVFITVDASDATLLDITINGVLTTRPIAGITKIELNGAGGDDILTIDPSVTIPATLEGGDGNDSLTGGS